MRKSNKGFTLVEIVLAIAVLAIVVTPILNSFITSYKVSAKSRKLMAANDAAQMVMEGFADKTYSDVVAAIKEGGLASESISFCSISDNYYNKMTNAVSVSSSNCMIQTCDIDTLKYTKDGSTSLSAVCLDLVSGNSIGVVSGFDICDLMEYNVLKGNASGKGAKLYYNITNDANSAVIGYSDIVNGGYHFDVAVCFYPTTSVSSNKYYSYGMSLVVYDYCADETFADEIVAGDYSNHPQIITMVSGLRAQ